MSKWLRKRAPRILADKWFRLALRNVVRSSQSYQPVSFEGRLLRSGKGHRDFEHRWKLIRREAEEFGARSLLDIGCAEGYFVQRAARELGCFSLGIEKDVQRLTVAQNINTLEHNELTGFMYAPVDTANLSCLPSFDIVLFLSVLHHIMAARGMDYSRDVLRIIRSKTNKVMIFDTGVGREFSDWARDLPGVDQEPSASIAEFVRSAGFSRVDLIGHTTADKARIARAMFRAFP